ncbi:hypothetical protein [Micromonospora sp. KC721]|uniref:hypothetical protein n=1 Tax=Micromonospora sp. KC721 TaxID=2530380 RepID=UPI001FB73366|nr:hypothetical protein [Micromonospora sp. KC721]
MAGSEPGWSDRAGVADTAGQQRQPEIEVTGEPPAAGLVGDAPTDRPSWPRSTRLLVAAAVVVLALGGLAVRATLANTDRLGIAFSEGGAVAPAVVPDEPGGSGAAQSAASGQLLTAPVDGRRRATFELVDGLSVVRLGAEDLGGDLYRVSTPSQSTVRARPEVVDDRVRLRVAKTGRKGEGSVDVVLNSRLVWDLRLFGGVSQHLLDLSAARLGGVEVVGGAARIDLRLPPVRGSLTIRMSGGVNQFTVQAPDRPPVRVRAGSGAGTVTVYEDRRDGVATGKIISSPNWDRATDRVYLDLVAGANTVTVTEG